MRKFQKSSIASVSAAPSAQPSALTRSTISRPAEYESDSGRIQSLCVNCEPKYCIRYTETLIPRHAPPHARRVCPADAIQFSEQDRRVEITDACVGCQLCLMRCPYGAIFDKQGTPDTLQFDAKSYRTADAQVVSELLTLPSHRSIKRSEARTAIDRAVSSLAATDKAVFYPLIGSLLTSVGLFTVVTRAGDTNNRMDAVVRDPKQSMPIEIKSPMEVMYINVKAVRQAIENKVVMQGRNMFPTTPDASTLAIGYQYPNSRSDVDELVEDAAAVFGINVGLVSLETLLVIAWNYHMSGDSSAAKSLFKLRGRASASIS